MHIEALTVMVIAVIFVSTMVRAVFGFGNALVAMPLLAMTPLGMKTATPLIALIAAFLALAIFVRDWHIIDFRSTWRLLVATIPGIPLGLFLLKGNFETIGKIILSLIIIGFSLYSLMRPRLAAMGREWTSYPFGFLAGVLGGAYNTNAPPIVIYGSLRKWPADRFRATLQGYFLPASLIIIAGHGLGGLWTHAVWRYFLLSLPALIISIWLGDRLHRLIPQDRFHRYVHVFLILIGATLLIRTAA